MNEGDGILHSHATYLVAIGCHGARPDVHREVDDQVHLLVQQQCSYVLDVARPRPFAVVGVVKWPLNCLYLCHSKRKKDEQGKDGDEEREKRIIKESNMCFHSAYPIAP